MSKISILNSVFSDIEKFSSADEYGRIIKLVEKRKYIELLNNLFTKLFLYIFIRYTSIPRRTITNSG